MKNFFIVISISTILFSLTWCKKQEFQWMLENDIKNHIQTLPPKATGIALCDSYLGTLQCITNNSTGTKKDTFHSSYESLIQSFQNVPAEQLITTCTTLSNALRSHPTLLKENPNCNIL
jgi:hypothetical protein